MIDAIRFALIVVLLNLVAGCEGDDDSASEPAIEAAAEETPATAAAAPAVNLEGAWSGSYEHPDITESITATIDQAGPRLTIETSRAGEAHHFTGYFRSDGSLYLTDSQTGELWTSIGPVGSHRFIIRDYLVHLFSPTNQPEQRVSLAR